MESSKSSAVALIFDPEMRRLATRSGSRSEPPRFAVRRRFYPEVREILDAIRRETGTDCIILRCLDAGDDERSRPRVYSALADADGGGLRPPFRWAAQSEVRLPDGVSLAEPANPSPQARQIAPGARASRPQSRANPSPQAWQVDPGARASRPQSRANPSPQARQTDPGARASRPQSRANPSPQARQIDPGARASRPQSPANPSPQAWRTDPGARASRPQNRANPAPQARQIAPGARASRPQSLANPSPQVWQRDPDWRSEISAWISDNLPHSVRQAGWSMAQIRSWAISTVFRIESDAARLYFKASPSYFGTEAALTERMAREFPDISPRVLAADAARGWLLMEDLGNDTLATAPSAAVWREAMGALARVQLAYAQDAAALRELRDMGIERRAPAAALQTLQTWIWRPESAELRVWRERFEEALRRLAPRVGELARMIRDLDALALPQTLDHGDLDATNIFIQNGSPILMDWSDAAISHPLFTAAMIRPVSRDPALADAYISHWASFASLDDLRQAFAISKILAAIDRAIHYRANIVPHLPDGSPELRDLERYIPDLLSLAAAELDRFP